MFDLSTLTLTVPLYIADAVLSGLYGLDLLKTRYEKKITVILWTMIYLAVDIVIYEILGIDRDVMGVVVNLVLLFTLQSLLFKWEYKKQIFVTFSFEAGRELLKYIISVLCYLISMLTGGMIERIISSSDGMTLERANNILTASMIVQGIICVAVYVIILCVYLKTLSRKYIYKGYETSFGENIFLVFPCFAALCVSITMRILILRFSERLGVLVYEQVPETVFWIIVICVLLLGTIIATMMLFQYLIERNEDSRKQTILENQVEQLHREIEDIEEIYTKAGYEVFTVSAEKNAGTDKLFDYLKGKTTAFAGLSGVGKSSLLSLITDDTLETGKVSEKIRRGRHTTRHVELFEIDGGFVLDTPGFGQLEVEGIKADELQNYFPEMADAGGSCRFRGCAHINEPDCYVKEKLENGEIAPSRYESYKAMYEKLKLITDWEKK